MSALTLKDVIENIEPKDPDWESKACAHVESLAIPPWSLGQVLTLGVQLAGIKRTIHPCVDKKMILTMAADHGIAEEGVSAFPQEVTMQMVANIVAGGAGVNVLGKASGAEVRLVDMREELAAGNASSVSRALADEISRNLARGEQTILLLNRRGYKTVGMCTACSEVVKCDACSVPMVYHKADGRLLCHYCGKSVSPVPEVCPACGGKLKYTGFGTQRVEEELEQMFPAARVLRMDLDTTARKNAHETMLRRFAKGEYDIMLGTQMVAKGLDFEKVTLVGVLGIDSLLFAQGFRAYENVFSLITQVVGRSGRARDPGFAIIQTTDPDNPVLNLAAAQDYDAFLSRKSPTASWACTRPSAGCASLALQAQRRSRWHGRRRALRPCWGQQAAKQPDLPLRVLGPTPGSIEKINDTYRYKLTIKCRNDRRFRDLVRSTLERYEQEKLPSKATVAVDLHSDGDI